MNMLERCWDGDLQVSRLKLLHRVIFNMGRGFPSFTSLLGTVVQFLVGLAASCSLIMKRDKLGDSPIWWQKGERLLR